jgi:hypothetical protein
MVSGYREPRDSTFWPAIEHPELAAEAAAWWPMRGGPSWDALALAHNSSGQTSVILVEAKANVPEFTAGSCKAMGKSLLMITNALDSARRALGATGPSEAWLGPHYQLANRIAWALWLRSHRIDAIFAHVLFARDSSHLSARDEELVATAHAGHEVLGIPASAIEGWCATIVLPATG